MKLVFYGGGDNQDNKILDQTLISISPSKKPKIAFIPSCSHFVDHEFVDFIKKYKRFNISKFLYFPVDVPFDSVMLRAVMNCDIIHLAGGNTFYFLKHLRKNGLIEMLRKFVARGGILTGLSAGAILMTPSIHTASLPDFDRDENHDNVKKLNSLGLVNFEFFPHYINSARYDRELLRYSMDLPYPLYASPDGSGIVLHGRIITFVGKNFCFYKGKKMSIKS
ncbi:MAG: Type 1 glutamine amidotransferase-like domain-containing protein [Bacteriovoracaceae bacterium]|nr:Type 1 glutamine amidotransferase-like domain-containing protein [Bacteriovoracaceae bacterium]